MKKANPMKNIKCTECINVNAPTLLDGPLKCSAFPQGVPEEILNGASHDRVIKGQKGQWVFTDISVCYGESTDCFGYDPANGSICIKCKHYQGHAKCAAFDDIPFFIIDAIGHDKPYIGQNKSKVAFEKK